MKKYLFLFIAVLVLGTVLSACGSSNGDDGSKSSGGDKKKGFKVAMVTDTGGVNDKSFNQSAWEGLQKFGKDNGLKLNTDYKYLQSNQASDYEPNLNTLVHNNGGYNLIFGIGYLMEDAVKKVAAANPNTHFAIVDDVVNAKNVTSITFKEEQGSFLVGVVAGMMTKTNKIGFVGGEKSALIKKFENGFKAGVKSVNPKADVLVQYAGSFSAADKGQAIANSQYGQGADIIYHAAGATGNGVFNEAQNRKKKGDNVWVIGVDRDQYDAGMPEDVTLTSMVKRVDNAVEQLSKDAMNGNYHGGENLQYGLKDNGVGLSEHHDHIPDNVMKKVDDYKKKIINGDIKPPQTDAEYKDFLASLK
ncbi:BMP family ABC transporter substrate-binding protein [Pullulanibacillus camelliae]|uniref:BMP family ABC transporter substrate-binding protein n=1 Tax=Pullulanibacillus camelliae TaxID=1707096 RepID=A0A8J2YIE0_9BACL|nr:BMP family protein [Pullulanibacillus camelliae]GGE44720.1 BMP family ABC transporter substrate-binding protein [Pullulanibacillus camelliae]